MKANIVDKLISRLDTSSDHAAEKVIRQLARIGKPALPALMRAGKDLSRPRIRKWSLQGIGTIGDSRGGPLLVEALRDERMTVRLHALKGLGRMKYQKALRPITRLLRDESGGIRVNALATLRELDGRSARGAVMRLLDDPQWYVRQAACEACGAWGAVRAKAKLRALAAKDARKAVRQAAAKALASLA
jgi:HEAT repeat protein